MISSESEAKRYYEAYVNKYPAKILLLKWEELSEATQKLWIERVNKDNDSNSEDYFR